MKITDVILRWYIWLYANDYIKLETLEKFYVPKLEYFIDKPETKDIVAQLELGLAEMDDGLQTEEELKNDLREAIK